MQQDAKNAPTRQKSKSASSPGWTRTSDLEVTCNPLVTKWHGLSHHHSKHVRWWALEGVIT